MKRREFITLVGGASALPMFWPLPLSAQQAMPVVGFLIGATLSAYAPLLAHFRQGLNEMGYVEGRNIAIEYRGADGRFDRLSALTSELIARGATLIVAGGIGSALAVRKINKSIPLVFLAGDDPVKFGLAASLNRPGGNSTGVAWLTSVLLAKRLELARELVPAAASIGILINPNSPEVEPQVRDIEAAARSVGQQIQIIKASSEPELDAAFATLAKQRIGAFIVSNDAYFSSQRDRIIELAARHKIPTIYDRREYAAVGGLICYGASYPVAYRELGIYAGKILKGAKPADLPIMQPTTFEMIINLRTAKALGLTVPPMLLARADEVIE